MYAGIEITIGNRWKSGAVEKTRYTTFWLLKKTVGNEHKMKKKFSLRNAELPGIKILLKLPVVKCYNNSKAWKRLL